MSTAAADENAPLLPTAQGESADVESRPQTYESLLRRISSADLPPQHEAHDSTTDASASAATIWTIVPVSLLGVFVANIDGSLIIASSQQIASEFNALHNASWLISSFILALCASQPLYGKLSDIFGRRSNLAVSYICFAAGCLLCGIGQQYWHVIAGRAISGIGAAGMTALVSIIIADVVPVREVASWRSYVNIAATTGRAMGGPLGGVLCDTIGWRWCFHIQVPFTVIGLLLILWKLPNKSAKSSNPDSVPTSKENLARVDVMGAFVLIIAIISFLLALEFVTSTVTVVVPIVLGVLCVISLILFFFIEKRWTKEPILDTDLFTQWKTLSAYAVAGMQMSAQLCVYYSVPIYFQIVSGYNVGRAGLQLVPAVVGNVTAGLLAGYLISRTGRYKVLMVIGNAGGCLGYLLIWLRWRGDVLPIETLYILLGGFASGMNQSTTFIHLAASLEPEKMAVAGTALYLVQNLFSLIGIQLSTALLQARLRIRLVEGLKGVKHKKQVIESAISSVMSIRSLPQLIKDIVIGAYLDGLTCTYGMSVVFATLGLIAALFLREQKL